MTKIITDIVQDLTQRIVQSILIMIYSVIKVWHLYIHSIYYLFMDRLFNFFFHLHVGVFSHVSGAFEPLFFCIISRIIFHAQRFVFVNLVPRFDVRIIVEVFSCHAILPFINFFKNAKSTWDLFVSIVIYFVVVNCCWVFWLILRLDASIYRISYLLFIWLMVLIYCLFLKTMFFEINQFRPIYFIFISRVMSRIRVFLNLQVSISIFCFEINASLLLFVLCRLYEVVQV